MLYKYTNYFSLGNKKSSFGYYSRTQHIVKQAFVFLLWIRIPKKIVLLFNFRKATRYSHTSHIFDKNSQTFETVKWNFTLGAITIHTFIEIEENNKSGVRNVSDYGIVGMMPENSEVSRKEFKLPLVKWSKL